MNNMNPSDCQGRGFWETYVLYCTLFHQFLQSSHLQFKNRINRDVNERRGRVQEGPTYRDFNGDTSIIAMLVIEVYAMSVEPLRASLTRSPHIGRITAHLPLPIPKANQSQTLFPILLSLHLPFTACIQLHHFCYINVKSNNLFVDYMSQARMTWRINTRRVSNQPPCITSHHMNELTGATFCSWSALW